MNATLSFAILCFVLLPFLTKTDATVTGGQETQREDSAEDFTDIIEYFVTINSSDSIPTFSEDHNKLFSEQRQHVLCTFQLQDTIIKAIKMTLNDVRKYDPLPLGDLPEYDLKAGAFQGLSSLRNTSALQIVCASDLATFTAQISVANPYVHFKWERRIYFFRIEGRLWIKADKVDVKLVIEVDNDYKLSLQHARITKFSNLKFGFSGLGPLNPLISGTINLFESIWNDMVIQQMEQTLQTELRKELSALAKSFS